MNSDFNRQTRGSKLYLQLYLYLVRGRILRYAKHAQSHKLQVPPELQLQYWYSYCTGSGTAVQCNCKADSRRSYIIVRKQAKITTRNENNSRIKP